ncbi:MAG: hypothetical protein OEV49_01060 [candidate division Zixibacteria bacterium]|nr:hypothetical protein [candidate division Zixibacteria bacterium]MDH3937993.1 hypothetical protein [candidate division Zixibacteria bacterium]MDH4035806.1 hypothetical protein [candidate division Zixibacteria bacterium]
MRRITPKEADVWPPTASTAASVRQLGRILLVAIVVFSCGWSLAQAAPEDWDIYLTIDNFGTVYAGTNTQTVGGPIGVSNSWPVEDHFTTTQPSDAYLYVAASSDHSIAQGFICKFINMTRYLEGFTGEPAWEVFPAGKYASALGIPDPWPASTQPTQAQVDAAIAYATANNLWVAPTSVPGYDLDPTTPTAPFSYVWGYGFPNIWVAAYSPRQAKWIWYESGLVPSGTFSTPFQAGNHHEFLVFRIHGTIPGEYIEDCGTIIQGVECQLFDSDNYGVYILADYGGFTVGDRVLVKGRLMSQCISFCQQGDGCFQYNTIEACPGIQFSVCGTIIQGVECWLLDADNGLVYEVQNFGSFNLGDRVLVRGIIPPECFSFCMQGDDCIRDNTIEACSGEIPTLTEWGMIIFCVLLFAWMAWMLAKRKKRITIGI